MNPASYNDIIAAFQSFQHTTKGLRTGVAFERALEDEINQYTSMLRADLKG